MRESDIITHNETVRESHHSDELKRISEAFTEEEFEKLNTIKDETELSWHDFILEMREVFLRAREIGLLAIPPERDDELASKLEELRSLRKT